MIFSHTSLAQDFNLPAEFGTIKLNSGFTPDPFTFGVVSGGSIDASGLRKGCAGFIANAPDFEFTFDSGSLDLYVSVISDEDTTLVINTPSGGWICDDDSGGDLDPSIHFSRPADGAYDVWIGTYDSTGTYEATLYISELSMYGD